MGPLLTAALNFLRADNWPVTVLDDEEMLQVYFQGEKGNWMCYAQAREELSQFVFYSILPLAAPPARRAAVGEFVNRANFGLVVGNFEFSARDPLQVVRELSAAVGNEADANIIIAPLNTKLWAELLAS